MRKTLLLFLLLSFVVSVFSQNRGFTTIRLNGISSEPLYKYSYALLIGESNYTNGWDRLPGVRQDIQAVKQALEQHGFLVIVKQDLTKLQMEQALSEFIAKYGQQPEARIIIYYAGHGYTIKNPTTGKSLGYIVPIDAPNPYVNKVGFITYSIPMTRFKEYAYSIAAKHALFIFDACFAGTIFSTRGNTPQPVSYQAAKPVRQFITSGDANEQVPDVSVFRKLLVRALTSDVADLNHDGYLTGTELGFYLQNEVVKYNNGAQHPRFGKILDPDLNQGEFIFVVKNFSEPAKKVVVQEQKITKPKPKKTYGKLQVNSFCNGQLTLESLNSHQVVATKAIKDGYAYTFDNLPTGKLVLKVTNGGQVIWSSQVSILPNQTAKIEISLPEEPQSPAEEPRTPAEEPQSPAETQQQAPPLQADINLQQELQNLVPQINQISLTSYDPSQKDLYRQVYYNLADLRDKCKAYKIGALDNPEYQNLFARLEQQGRLDEFLGLIKDIQQRIEELMRYERFGADSIEAINAYMAFRNYYRAQDYSASYPYWRLLLRKYPKSTKSIYLTASKILDVKIQNATDEAERQAWLDTLMQVYDQFKQLYPDKAPSALAKKTIYMYKYGIKDQDLNSPEVIDRIQAAYQWATEAIELGYNSASLYVIAAPLSFYMYELQKIPPETFIANMSDYLQGLEQLLNTSNAKAQTLVRRAIPLIYQVIDESDLADCNKLQQVLSERYDSFSNNYSLRQKIKRFLQQRNCTNIEIYSRL